MCIRDSHHCSRGVRESCVSNSVDDVAWTPSHPRERCGPSSTVDDPKLFTHLLGGHASFSSCVYEPIRIGNELRRDGVAVLGSAGLRLRNTLAISAFVTLFSHSYSSALVEGQLFQEGSQEQEDRSKKAMGIPSYDRP